MKLALACLVFAASKVYVDACAGQRVFDIRMCTSHMCNGCALAWCVEACQKLQAEFPGCRCNNWPEDRESFSDGDFRGKGKYGDVGDYSAGNFGVDSTTAHSTTPASPSSSGDQSTTPETPPASSFDPSATNTGGNADASSTIGQSTTLELAPMSPSDPTTTNTPGDSDASSSGTQSTTPETPPASSLDPSTTTTGGNADASSTIGQSTTLELAPMSPSDPTTTNTPGDSDASSSGTQSTTPETSSSLAPVDTTTTTTTPPASCAHRFWRLQITGINASGREQYIGELAFFRRGDRVLYTTLPSRIIPAAFSCRLGDQSTCAYAMDGTIQQGKTGYRTVAGGPPYDAVTMDAGKAVEVGGIFLTQFHKAEYGFNAFEVQSSDDQNTWKTEYIWTQGYLADIKTTWLCSG